MVVEADRLVVSAIRIAAYEDGFSASKQAESVDVTCDEDAALPTVIKNSRMVEIVVQRAEHVGSTDQAV